jgi:hypothetical protein
VPVELLNADTRIVGVNDLLTCDPSLALPLVGGYLERGVRADLLSGLPLRLLVTMADDGVRGTVEWSCAEVARMVSEDWQSRRPASS